MLPLLLTLLSASLQSSEGFDYCSLQCLSHGHWINHTVCLYKPGGPTECAGWRTIQMTRDVISYLEDMCNNYRSTAALGQLKGRRPAANMVMMSWSDDLQVSAQRWAEQCNKETSDDCRIAMDKTGTDQFIWPVNLSSTTVRPIEAIQQMVTGYLGEHYEVFLNSRSDRFGCGMTYLRISNGLKYRMVCNFYGVRNDRKLYIDGAACSKCPPNTRCNPRGQFPALCAQGYMYNGQGPVMFWDSNDAYAQKYKKTHGANHGPISAPASRNLFSVIVFASLLPVL